ncbi:MAG: aminodeoxychorismate synthase component I [Acidobacteria bacterium]|nr:aminodeoxychorismate synthase component I [Acidobacteriota bacterium]
MTPWHPLPPQVLKYIEQTPGTVLLHSSRPGKSSVSRLFTAPLQIIEIRRIQDLALLFPKIEEAVEQGLFAAGYFTYECAQYFEPAVPVRPRSDSDLLAYFGIYATCHTFDHRTGAFDSSPSFSTSPAQESNSQSPQTSPTVTFSLDEKQFASRIEQVHDWISGGDVYQLNFTFPFQAQSAESPSDLYSRLTAAQPVDYGAFLHTYPGHHILSFSPELFFRIDNNRRITSQPMKGTAPRGRTTSEDRTLAEWLANDQKNRAENVMIVDLIRNDLGRVCSFGSVKVEQLFEVEKYLSLWQMTSRISGDLRPEVSYEDIFRALFPCGSITGAPKVRAMQLIGQIEENPRGAYTGAIGYFSREQTVFNVAIRTLECDQSRARGGVGSGIVIDSKPADEYRECLLKAEFLTSSPEPFSLIETMLWSGTYPLLELHLNRLADSALYFDLVFERVAIRDTLLAAATCFADDRPRKVRLLLSPNGETQIESELLPISGLDDQPLRASIATIRTSPADRFLLHKTTRRELYRRAYAAANSAGFTDVLFLNTREEVTEGSAHSIFLEKSGQWYTPPLDCGVLPGVFRRHLLTTRKDIKETILTLNDLKAADGVYLCNAVRGLRSVSIDFEADIGI